jgi:hypothetical protein
VGGSFQAARSIAAITLSLAATGGAACSSNYDGPGYCPDPSVPSLRVDTSAAPLGTVTTQGACSEVHCATSEGSGCSLWEGEITSLSELDTCTIVLTLPDGRRLTKVAHRSLTCGIQDRTPVTFVP